MAYSPYHRHSASRSFLRICCVLVGVSLAGPASAVTLEELYAGGTIISGPLEFTDWSPAPGNNDANPASIEVLPTSTAEDRFGFSVDDMTGGLNGVDALNYHFTVRAVTPLLPEVTGAQLDLRQWSISGDGSVAVSLSDSVGVLLSVKDPPFGNDSDSRSFDPPVPPPFQLRHDVSATAEIGTSEVGTYRTEFIVVPEPGTALLKAISVTVLALLRRSRPAATRETA